MAGCCPCALKGKGKGKGKGGKGKGKDGDDEVVEVEGPPPSPPVFFVRFSSAATNVSVVTGPSFWFWVAVGSACGHP